MDGWMSGWVDGWMDEWWVDDHLNESGISDLNPEQHHLRTNTRTPGLTRPPGSTQIPDQFRTPGLTRPSGSSSLAAAGL